MDKTERAILGVALFGYAIADLIFSMSLMEIPDEFPTWLFMKFLFMGFASVWTMLSEGQED